MKKISNVNLIMLIVNVCITLLIFIFICNNQPEKKVESYIINDTASYWINEYLEYRGIEDDFVFEKSNFSRLYPKFIYEKSNLERLYPEYYECYKHKY